MLISHKGHTDTIQVYSVTVMTHVKALQAGHSSQGTSEPITPAPILSKINNNKIKFRMDLKWPEIPSKVNFGHPKWPIDLKWPAMRSKVIFGHPKLTPKKKICINLNWPDLRSKMADRSEMARNANESEFPFYQKFQQKLKLRIDLIWPEMRSKVNFGHPIFPPAAIL